MNKSKIINTVFDYVVISFGILLFCMGWTSFLIPGGIASGGVTGLCTIIFFATGIPVSLSYAVVNVFLLILGFLVLGNGFGVKTIYAIALSTVLFDVLPRFDFLVVTFDDRLFTALVGGMVEAVGIGLTLMKGGSSGGTDIIAMIINKYWPVSPGRVYLFTDLFIVASVLLVPEKTVNDMIYGYVTMITFSFAVDWVLLGNKSSVQLQIFSQKYAEIADFITKDLHRGVTVIEAEGWYSKQERNVLLVICRKAEYSKIVEAVRDIDQKAFISISSVNSVYGEGFEEMKTGLKRKKNVKKTEDSSIEK